MAVNRKNAQRPTCSVIPLPEVLMGQKQPPKLQREAYYYVKGETLNDLRDELEKLAQATAHNRQLAGQVLRIIELMPEDPAFAFS